jgi:hypothetical protein
MLLKTLKLKNRRGAIHVGANTGAERDWYVDNGFFPVLWLITTPPPFDKDLNKFV